MVCSRASAALPKAVSPVAASLKLVLHEILDCFFFTKEP